MIGLENISFLLVMILKNILEIILLKFGVLIKIILDISIVEKIKYFCCLMGFFIVLILIYESLSF
jgi:hypothetical protein